MRHYIVKEGKDIQMAGNVRVGRKGRNWLVEAVQVGSGRQLGAIGGEHSNLFRDSDVVQFLSHIFDDDKVLLSKMEDVNINPSNAYPCHATWRSMYWDPSTAAREQLHNSSNSLPPGHMLALESR